MRYNKYRRGLSIGSRGEDIERAVLDLDEYLYVDVNIHEPGGLQVWRKHPSSHLPIHILDVPQLASVGSIVRKLDEMDHADIDIVGKMVEQSERKRRENKIKKRYEAEQFAKNLGKFIQNNL